MYIPSKLDFNIEAFWMRMLDLPFGCMNKKMSNLIGNTIGIVKDYDVREDGTTWGKALQVFIEMDLQKPIYGSQTLNLQGNKV